MSCLLRKIIYTLIIVGAVFLTLHAVDTENKVVRGKYGKFCYADDKYPKTIKNKLTFDSFEECYRSLIY